MPNENPTDPAQHADRNRGSDGAHGAGANALSAVLGVIASTILAIAVGTIYVAFFYSPVTAIPAGMALTAGALLRYCELSAIALMIAVPAALVIGIPVHRWLSRRHARVVVRALALGAAGLILAIPAAAVISIVVADFPLFPVFSLLVGLPALWAGFFATLLYPVLSRSRIASTILVVLGLCIAGFGTYWAQIA